MTPVERRGNVVVAIVFIVCATIVWVTYLAVRAGSTSLCRDFVQDPALMGAFQCPDPRQKLTVPPGWTWFKCECPHDEEVRR